MKTLYMLVGVPGSGKSTWIENDWEDSSERFSTTLSSDQNIHRLAKIAMTTYNDSFSELVGMAEQLLFMQLAVGIKNEDDILWDQTNLSVKSRSKKLAKIPEDYKKVAVFFETPPVPVLKHRLNNPDRDKKIPWSIVESMIQSLEIPTLEEGFDEIKFVSWVISEQ